LPCHVICQGGGPRSRSILVVGGSPCGGLQQVEEAVDQLLLLHVKYGFGLAIAGTPFRLLLTIYHLQTPEGMSWECRFKTVFMTLM
jgi:hypothetical protein